MGVAIGFDSHKSSLAASAVDELGRIVSQREFANDPRGHDGVEAWLETLGDDRVVGIEGSRRYAFALATRLVAAGETVVEVPAFLTRRERKARPSQGKSDVADAIAIARVVARHDGTTPVNIGAINDDLKLLVDRRDQLVRARTQTSNRIHKQLVVLQPGYENTIRRITRPAHIAAVRKLIRGDSSIRADVIRDLLTEFLDLDKRVTAITQDITALVIASGTTLTQLEGVGFLTAAKILGELGDVTRIRSRAAFAMLNGTAPLEVSSGRVKRHRLNRGGNRQLNHALHMIALSRCRRHDATKVYRAKRISEGASNKEAMRSLKRHLSNVVYRQLMKDLDAVRVAP